MVVRFYFTSDKKSSNSMQVGVPWAPQNAGAYELRTFAISGLNNPRILALVSSSRPAIATSLGSYPLDIK